MRVVKRRSPRLVTIGDVMLDIIVRAGDPESGTDVRATIRFRAGGSAANTARAFAGLGGRATLIGAIGDDSLGKRVVAALRATGVKVHPVARRGTSARLVALVDRTGQRSFITDRGVADDLPRSALKASWLRGIDVLHLPAYSLLGQPIGAAALRAVEIARDHGALVSIDLASRRPLLDAGRAAVKAALAQAAPDVLLANLDEAGAVVGRRQLKRLLELAPVAVIKEGAAGCRVMWRGDNAGEMHEIDVATRSLAVSDTTGAGDAFDAGFLFALAAAGHGAGFTGGAAVLRRASLAGHRSAARLLTSARPELAL